MKKILYSLAVIILFVTTFNFTILYKRINSESYLILQNIEALSYAETINAYCFGIGSLDCPNSNEKVKVVL